MRGHLYIHIGGYKYSSDYKSVIFMDDAGKTHALPDRAVPAPVFEPGTVEWAEYGWSVGDNPRERFCKWITAAKNGKRKFLDFDEAASYVSRLRQKRRKHSHERYSLVYVWMAANSRETERVIETEADIAAIDAATELEIEQIRLAKQDALTQYPGLEKLLETHAAMRAHELAHLLKRIQDEGQGAAFQGVSKATAYPPRRKTPSNSASRLRLLAPRKGDSLRSSDRIARGWPLRATSYKVRTWTARCRARFNRDTVVVRHIAWPLIGAPPHEAAK